MQPQSAQTDDNAIEAVGLVKRYGDKVALAGVSFEVRRGTVCGLLGPNGAGKTTAVRILTTLAKADGGTARVAASTWSTSLRPCVAGWDSPRKTRPSIGR